MLGGPAGQSAKKIEDTVEIHPFASAERPESFPKSSVARNARLTIDKKDAQPYEVFIL